MAASGSALGGFEPPNAWRGSRRGAGDPTQARDGRPRSRGAPRHGVRQRLATERDPERNITSRRVRQGHEVPWPGHRLAVGLAFAPQPADVQRPDRRGREVAAESLAPQRPPLPRALAPRQGRAGDAERRDRPVVGEHRFEVRVLAERVQEVRPRSRDLRGFQPPARAGEQPAGVANQEAGSRRFSGQAAHARHRTAPAPQRVERAGEGERREHRRLAAP
jgi:hypothetical protein